MDQVLFHLRYPLSRSQRLVPHLQIWGTLFTLFVLFLFSFFCVRSLVAVFALDVSGLAVFGGLALGMLLPFRGLFVGLLDVALVPVRNVDVVFVENAAGILMGDDRWWLFLDGITDIRMFKRDVWTVQHFNGAVLHMPASAITEEQLAHLKTAMEFGRTPEGIRKVIERGKVIKELTEQERKGRGRDHGQSTSKRDA
ncbi:MAG: hypothetical protein ACP5XB_11955 [Isosphaeraceae bacterium]